MGGSNSSGDGYLNLPEVVIYYFIEFSSVGRVYFLLLSRFAIVDGTLFALIRA